MNVNKTICAAALKNDMLLLTKRGIAKREIEYLVGISIDQLDDPDEMVSMKYYVALEKAAPILTKNPAFFIELGSEKTGTSQTGIVGHVAASCETIRESFQQAVRFSHLLSDATRMELKEEGGLASFVFMRDLPEYLTVQSVELAFSRTLALMKDLWGEDFQANEIHFQYSAPDYVKVYRNVFKHILFNQPENCIIFPSNLLNQKNPYYKPYIHEIVLKHAEKMLEKRTIKETLEQQTRSIILKHLPKGMLNAELVASELHMSRQTLFRKLKSESGLSFQELLKTTRKELAKEFVTNKSFMLTDIAYLLGFSESSAFHRAFKSWYNYTPGEFRRQMTQA
jgi:AraC-like DNA-binding protein